MRTRRNGSVIGRRNSLVNYDRSGIWNGEDYFHAKADRAIMLDNAQRRLPTQQWHPEPVGADPHFDRVLIHFKDCDYPNGMMRDQTGNGGEMYLQTVDNNSHPINTWFGPRYRDWCTKFHENDRYDVADTAGLRFGNNTFVIEFWYKGLRQDATQHYIMGKGANAGVTSGTGWTIGINTSYQVFFYDAQNNTTITASTTLLRDRWYHIAIVRASQIASGLRIMVDGVNTGTGQSNGNFTDTNPLRIGIDRVATTTTWFGGKITDIRIVTNTGDGSGIGRYFGGFAPPTAPLDMTVTGTQFSLSMYTPHHDTFPLAHPQGVTITRASNTTAARVIDSPFLNNTTKLTGHGAYSLYSYENACWYRQYDTNPVRNFQFGTGAFTVECWVYITINNRNIAIAGKGTGNSTSGSGWSFWVDGSGYLRWDSDSTAINTSPTNPLEPGGWYHVAAVRVSTLPNQFGLFVNGLPTYTGTLTANYNQTDWLAVFASRNAQYVSWGYIAGFRISGVARYTPGNSFNATVEPDNGGVTFCDTSMAVDANTWVLYGTTGTDEPGPAYEHYGDKGTNRSSAPRRNSNELRYGTQHGVSRSGYSWRTWRDASQSRICLTDNGAGNFTFGTGDFSMEWWLKWVVTDDWYGTNFWRIITCWKASFNDNHFRMRMNQAGSIELEYGGRPLMNDNLHSQGINMQNWHHICLQRTSGKLALYVQGTKIGEIVFTDSLGAPNSEGVTGGINFMNDSFSNLAYTSMYLGNITDIRILKGSSAYGIGTKNPEYIRVPTTFLPVITNTVFLCSARYPFLNDIALYPAQNNPNNIEIGGRNRGNFTNAWDVYSMPESPYSAGIPWDKDRQNYLGSWDETVGWYSPSVYAGNDSYVDECSFINRMSGPWTIEFWTAMVTQNPAADSNRRQILYTATTNGHIGFQVVTHENSGQGYDWGNINLRFWGPNDNFALGSWPGSRTRIHCPNHVAFVYDPAATNKMAAYCNGYRVNTRAAFAAGTRVFQTYTLRSDAWGNGACRISRVARYNNDAITYTIPTSHWTYDANTVHLQTIYTPIPDIGLKNNHFWYGRGGMPVYKYKKFGNASLGFNNYDTSTQSDYIYLNYGGTWNVYTLDVRRSDFTIECWAMHFAQTSGGRAINASVGNVLWHFSNNLCMQINTTGFWRLRIANAAGTGLVSNNNQGYYDINPGTWLATTSVHGLFDHIAVVRRGGNFHLYINGVEIGTIWGSVGGTFPGGTGPTSDNGNIDYYNNDFQLGSGYGSQTVTGWTGCIQDFRMSGMARYETRTIRWGGTAYTITGSSNGVINTSGDVTTMCPSQPITFSSTFGGISSGTTYYIRTIETGGFSVSTSVGGAVVTAGTTSGLSITGTTQTTLIPSMVYPESNEFALPRGLLPTY